MRTPSHKEIHNRPPHPMLISAGVWFAVLSWGGSFVAARFLLHPGTARLVSLSPAVLAALRFSIASLFFIIPLAHAIIRRQISGRNLLLMALLGQLTFSLYFLLQYIGIQETNASISSILVVGLIPIVTALLARAFGEERLNMVLWGALPLGFIGVALIVLQQPLSVTLQSGFLVGVLCLLSNAFAFAVYSNLSKRWMRDISPVVMTGGTMISGAIGLVLLSLLDPVSNHWSDVARLDIRQWMALLFLAVVCSVLAFFAYNVALSKMDASRVSVYIYFEPVVAVLFGVTLLGEHLNWQIIVGAAAIGGSVAMVNLVKKKV